LAVGVLTGPTCQYHVGYHSVNGVKGLAKAERVEKTAGLYCWLLPAKKPVMRCSPDGDDNDGEGRLNAFGIRVRISGMEEAVGEGGHPSSGCVL
jgi:hypothetical protein